MKFAIDCGHNCAPFDTGAVGYGKEDELTKEVSNLLIKKLKGLGHLVVECCPAKATGLNDSLRQRALLANQSHADTFVSIHFNAAFKTEKAMGTEVYAITSPSQAIARNVLSQIVKLGFKNRGVKPTPFYVLKSTYMPSILIECCFVDSQADMKLFDAEKMASAICLGLTGKDKPIEDTSIPGTLVILEDTLLKPSTEQSTAIKGLDLKPIAKGEYRVLDCKMEEGHYWVKMEDNEYFVYCGHSKFIASPSSML